MIDPFQLPAEAACAPRTYVGPFDREAWPERLIARVVSTGDAPRIRGYAIGELARDHGLTEVAWLALRGELPGDGERAALEVALVLLAPVHIGQAPS
ncbi:MAG: hypothetical protein K8W52_29640, partial [Deltaproteobacteria bacterium]|nr:hypothetical protein [Deltaproteobacteria bacterium]